MSVEAVSRCCPPALSAAALLQDLEGRLSTGRDVGSSLECMDVL
jgi:hypothetical protein